MRPVDRLFKHIFYECPATTWIRRGLSLAVWLWASYTNYFFLEWPIYMENNNIPCGKQYMKAVPIRSVDNGCVQSNKSVEESTGFGQCDSLCVRPAIANMFISIISAGLFHKCIWLAWRFSLRKLMCCAYFDVKCWSIMAPWKMNDIINKTRSVCKCLSCNSNVMTTVYAVETMGQGDVRI